MNSKKTLFTAFLFLRLAVEIFWNYNKDSLQKLFIFNCLLFIYFVFLPSRTDFMEVAIIAGGCFWCTEAIFKRLIGVEQVEVGFVGGSVPEPSYKEVCKGDTGHAEAIRITYDPKQLSYLDILEVFWQAHDPTTLNRQGEDEGTQYRSAIFYLDENLHQAALQSKERIAHTFAMPIVTEIVPAGEFYPVQEDYLINYYENNSDRGYCIFTIAPKINKIYNLFQEKIKPTYQALEHEDRTQKTI